MKTYAYIENGVVVEIIGPVEDADGKEIPIIERFSSSFVAKLVDVSSAQPMPAPGWSFDGSTFSPALPAALAQAKAQQVAGVSAACEASLMGGFISSALGSARTYGSNDNDQRNLLNAGLVSQGQAATWKTQLWCAKDGVWSLADHTAPQVQQVNADWLAFRLSQQSKCTSLAAQINAASTVAEVLAINW